MLVNNAGITGGGAQQPTDRATSTSSAPSWRPTSSASSGSPTPCCRCCAARRRRASSTISSGVGSLTRQTGPGGDPAGPIAVAYAPSKTFLNAVTVQYAKELAGTNILINLACPGFVATDLNGFRGARTPEQGAATAIRLATLPDGGPTGGFFEDAGASPGDRARRSPLLSAGGTSTRSRSRAATTSRELAGLGDEGLDGVALGEVGQHELAGARGGGDAGGLDGGEVAVVAGLVGVAGQVGRLADQQVDATGERDRVVAHAGVHDEGDALSRRC